MRQKRQKPIQFYKVPAQLGLKLAQAKAGWALWAMVLAISEAWYRNGHHQSHPNTFPLVDVDTEKWGINRSQKHRSTKFLIKIDWIIVDRSDPKNPLITMTQPAASED
jgi:hypothetical protein